jgi:hypothetical protein
MKILQFLSNFEFTVIGGLAWYFLICTAYVTFVGIFEMFKWIFNWVNN